MSLHSFRIDEPHTFENLPKHCNLGCASEQEHSTTQLNSIDERNSTFDFFCCSIHLMADIKPIHVCKWMCHKAFGKEDPAQDDHPVRRSATIAHWKKAISHFFHTAQKWNETSQTGNPTQSALVNKLIEAVKRQEMRGNGADAKADRAFTEDEHCQVPELLRARDDARTTAMTNFQHHLIARMDDVAHVKKDAMQASCQFEVPLDLSSV